MRRTDRRYDVAVVGGGFAGVTAARELAAAGQTTVLLEARDRLGGRTWTTSFGDMQVELGGAWVHWHQPHVWAELSRYGIGVQEDDWRYDVALVGDPVRRHDPHDALVRISDAFRTYVPEELFYARRPYEPSACSGFSKADRLSMGDRLAELNLAPDETEWLTSLLYEMAGSDLGQAGLLTVVRWMSLCDWSTDRWFDTNRYRPKGGTIGILEAMLSPGQVEVRYNSPVTSIAVNQHGVELRARDGTAVHSSAVVVAVPVNVWPTISFVPRLPAAHRALAAAGVGKPHQDKVWVRIRGLEERVLGQLPAPSPLNFFWTFEQSEDSQVLVAINANPRLNVTDREEVAAVMAAYLPKGVRIEAVSGHRWGSDPYARGGNSSSRPGQLIRYLGEVQQRYDRLTFATADIANGWVGYIDGAIESGLRAARQCLSVDQ